MYNYDSYTMI